MGFNLSPNPFQIVKDHIPNKKKPRPGYLDEALIPLAQVCPEPMIGIQGDVALPLSHVRATTGCAYSAQTCSGVVMGSGFRFGCLIALSPVLSLLSALIGVSFSKICETQRLRQCASIYLDAFSP